MNAFTAVDLFCGCGGLSRGLQDAGFEIRAGLDSWKPAVAVYEANNRHEAILHDLSNEEATYERVRSFNPFLIAGGPPCQDFSIAGRKVEGDRADLTVKYARLIARIKPHAFIMENVERAAQSEAYKAATEIFREAGYGITRRVLDASKCGVPQKRKRLFMIGVLGEAEGFLDDRLDAVKDNRPMTVREYMGNDITFEHYYRHPRTYGRRGIYGIDEPSATIRGVNRPMPPNYRKHEGDAVDPSSGVEALSFRHRARIQTFPADYVWPEKIAKGTAEQMIGNAVPVGLAAFVGRSLLAHLAAANSSQETEATRFLAAAE